jgi:pilus assembly protein CpaC
MSINTRLSSRTGMRRAPWILGTALWACCLGSCITAFAQQYPGGPASPFPTYFNTPQSGIPSAAPMLTIPAPTGSSPSSVVPAAQSTASMVLPVQNTPDSARAIHKLIEALPTSQEELELIERRSQLMITKANLQRIQIADPAILDVVQYSPRELSLIGLARGTTTMMLWFEGHDQPVIYLVKTIRDPAWNMQRQIDYGKLERKINTLFPNSKVYLIPMSWKILVRGQARDQEEAAHILMVIRGEVIGQDGALWGPQARNVDPGGYGGLGPGGYGLGGNGVGGIGNGFDSIYGNGFGNGYNNGLWSSFIINELRVPGDFQISLRVRIAELNRSQARNMGIDWSILFSEGSQIVTNMGGGVGTIGSVFESGDYQLNTVLNWLAANGTAKILSEPNVVVLSGRQARFLAGGEFAVPTTVGIGGAAGQTTSFRGFGTSLLVTPAVVDRDLIRITTTAEYSDINNNNTVQGIPGTDSRRVETTVEMREGQTLALAGLLSHRQVTEVTRIPGLGAIPKIGPLLFSSKRSTMEENELLILITPEIVRPMDAHEVPPVPGFEVTHPSDYDFYYHNMTEGMPDTGYYQVPPYGSGSIGTNVGYQHFNPGPAGSMYSPQPTNQYGTGFSSPAPVPNGMPSGPATAVPPSPVIPLPQAMPAPSASYQPQPHMQPMPPVPRNSPWTATPSQTIQPANHVRQGPPVSPNAQRPSRDQRPGNRY